MKDNRLRIALHPEVFKMLEVYKDKIHDHASKRRVPMSWNEFFMIIVNDWESGRTKCVCGTFYDCKMCDTEKALSRIKLGDHSWYVIVAKNNLECQKMVKLFYQE